MLISKGNNTYQGGPLDVLCILHEMHTGRYHAAFFEESPLPGPVKSLHETDVVRLKSKMHHTEGSDTLAGAVVHLEELATQIHLPESNIWKEPIEWDGSPVVMLRSNWLK